MSKLIELHDINRAMWIAYEWIEVTAYGEIERQFIQGKMRTPEEGARAAGDWDIWWPFAYDACRGKLKVE